MAKEIFRVGDRVFDIRYGWGTIVKYNATQNYPIEVKFDKNDLEELIRYTKYGKDYKLDDVGLLSFTEYGFDDRFTQERPINYDDYIGRWGKFWDDGSKDYMISRFEKLRGDGFKPIISVEAYDNFEPLTEAQVKVLEL